MDAENLDKDRIVYVFEHRINWVKKDHKVYALETVYLFDMTDENTKGSYCLRPRRLNTFNHGWFSHH